MFLSKITELIVWEFSSGNSLQDFCSWSFGPSVMKSVNGKAFSVMGPNNYQINSLGKFSGNDPVKIDTEYDRAKVPPYNGNYPRPPLVV